jgi:hypothetical protein
MFRNVTTRLSGLVILIAGLWGGLIPFVGPYFHFVLGPDHAWRWTTGRLWLNVLPGAIAALGGVILLGAGPRISGRVGALLALAAGAWFAVGPDVSRLWQHGGAQGIAHGTHVGKRMLESLTFHTGLGVLITAFAAYALPGAMAFGRRRLERDAAVGGAGAAVGAAEAHHRDPVAAREAEPVAAREGEPVAAREGEPVAAREAEPVGGAPARDGGTATAAQPMAAQTGTRRRGGLAGLFSRR